MGFGKKLKKIVKRSLPGLHLSRKQFKSFRKKMGLTSKNKFARQLKRSISPRIDYYEPTSASSVGSGYMYNGRTLSQLTGGV